ncbi:MAG: hypothetical protein ACLT9Y_03965 [Peptostreptococcus anaerobius]
MIVYESPHRLKETLKLMLDILGDRKISLCRELTKKHEDYMRSSIDEAISYYKEMIPEVNIY